MRHLLIAFRYHVCQLIAPTLNPYALPNNGFQWLKSAIPSAPLIAQTAVLCLSQSKTGSVRNCAAIPRTQLLGFLCAKVAQYLEREYSPNRLLLSAASHRIERLGSEAALPYSYAGTMGLLNNRGMDRRFFHRFGASRLDHG